MFHVIPPNASHAPKKGKVTCVTCKLKGCVGHCRFEVVGAPATRGTR